MIILPLLPFELGIVKALASFIAFAKPLTFIAVAFADIVPGAVAIALSLFVWKKFRRGTQGKEAVIVALVSGIVARLGITSFIRVFFDRPRPFEVFGIMSTHETGYAFPSGHAASFFGFAFALWPYHRKASIAMCAVAVGMGFARVAIAMHWPSDIVAGAVVGFLGAWVTRWGRRAFAKSDPSTPLDQARDKLLGMFFPKQNKSAP